MPKDPGFGNFENPYASPASAQMGAERNASGMRVTGYLIVAASFVAIALLTDATIWFVGYDSRDLALGVAAIVASQVGTLVWRRQSPDSSERSVKLGLGVALSTTAVVFALAYQAVTTWLTYPEIVVPIAGVGCFVLPFAVVGTLWRSLQAKRSGEEAGVAG